LNNWEITKKELTILGNISRKTNSLIFSKSINNSKRITLSSDNETNRQIQKSVISFTIKSQKKLKSFSRSPKKKHTPCQKSLDLSLWIESYKEQIVNKNKSSELIDIQPNYNLPLIENQIKENLEKSNKELININLVKPPIPFQPAKKGITQNYKVCSNFLRKSIKVKEIVYDDNFNSNKNDSNEVIKISKVRYSPLKNRLIGYKLNNLSRNINKSTDSTRFNNK